MGVIKKRLRIGGMTCINCQNKIERKLKNTAGIQEAAVSYSTGIADITYDSDMIGLKDITAVIERLDYEVLPADKKPETDMGRNIGLLVIILALYILLQEFGILNMLVPSQLADTKMGYGMLFVIGLITSVHCIAMCGGINLSQCIGQIKDKGRLEGGCQSSGTRGSEDFVQSSGTRESEDFVQSGGTRKSEDFVQSGDTRESEEFVQSSGAGQADDAAGSGSALAAFLPSALYNLGRVISYTVIGFILGLIGMAVGGGSGTGLPALFQGILKLIAGVVMVIMGINMLGIFPWLRRFQPRLPGFLAVRLGRKKAAGGRPLVVGLINGLMPCGPLQSMQIVALASGNPFAGALSMFLFSLGTVPLMLGLGSLVAALGRRFSQAVMAVGSVLVTVLGLAMLSQGGSLSGLLLPDRLLLIIIILCLIGVAASIPFDRKQYRAACVAAAIVVAACVGAAWGDISEAIGIGGAGGDAGLDGDGNTAGNVEIVDGVQVVNSTLEPGRYPDITVQAGIPVKWVINAPAGSINGCNYRMILNKYAIVHDFYEGENVITFTPTEVGTVEYTCWMGMIHGNIYVTKGTAASSSAAASSGEESGSAAAASSGEESDSAAATSSGAGSGSTTAQSSGVTSGGTASTSSGGSSDGTSGSSCCQSVQPYYGSLNGQSYGAGCCGDGYYQSYGSGCCG